MQVFYSQQINLDNALLSEEESNHATKVLRMRMGDKLLIINGKGELLRGEITSIGKKNTVVGHLVLEKKIDPPVNKIVLFVSPLRNVDRFEWLVEKATELGVTDIVPVVCKNTVKKGSNTNRLNHIALSATKQCLRLFLPRIHEANDFNKIEFDKNAFKFFGYCGEEEKRSIADLNLPNSDIHVFIGPEGDFSHQELEMMKKNDSIACSFGEDRLRTETAAIFALSAVKLKLNL